MSERALFIQAAELHQAGKFQEARNLYNQVLASMPHHIETLLHLAIIEHQERNTAEAVTKIDRLLAIDPNHIPAHSSRGILLMALRRNAEAIASFDRVLAAHPEDAAAHHHRAMALEALHRYPEAILSYAYALHNDPDIPIAQGRCLHLSMKLCDWRDWHALVALLAVRTEAGSLATGPFELHSLPSTLTQQRKVAEAYFNFAVGKIAPTKLPPAPHRDKIRVGYFSSDFCLHAVSLAIAELFEAHDKTQFEIFAFLLSPRREDAMQQRLRLAFDHFIDVSAQSDFDIAHLARSLGINIAVDLMGYTTDCRPGIFGVRAAPIQVSYIGFPGTMGTECIDYIIADEIVLPEHHRPHYSENVVYLPHSYQANDSKRVISDKPITRNECGLPESATVFCCFNLNYKINPDVFDGWMRILDAVKGSVLWVYALNPTARDNLRKEAEQRGISPDRIIFAPFADMAVHLARHRLADLFLDTFPYGGHGTASHALWPAYPC